MRNFSLVLSSVFFGGIAIALSCSPFMRCPCGAVSQSTITVSYGLRHGVAHYLINGRSFSCLDSLTRHLETPQAKSATGGKLTLFFKDKFSDYFLLEALVSAVKAVGYDISGIVSSPSTCRPGEVHLVDDEPIDE